jgi:class 3 adenylate cyclase
MAAFPAPEAALSAALAMQAEFEPWCRSAGLDPPLVLKIGLHAGPAVVVTANERLDYFGRSINLAARIQKQAGGGEVALTEELWVSLAGAWDAADGTPLGEVDAERFEARLPGIVGSVRLVRLRPSAL